MVATPTTALGFQNFFQATLTSDITATSTDIPLDNIPNATEGFLVIDPDSASGREVIFYNSKTALKVVCPSAADGRGQDDTTASPQSSGTTVIMAPVAGMFEALQNGRATNSAFSAAQLGAIHRYTYDGTDIFVDGVDQNNAANTINWTKPTGLKFVVVEVQGGGGGGAATPATSGTQYAVGTGGGGGVYATKKVLVGDLGATEVVTVGALGAGGTTGNGTAGGSSSFGAHATAGGGTAGATSGVQTVDVFRSGTAPNTSGTGDLVVPGSLGGGAIIQIANNNKALGGFGGSSRFGTGGYEVNAVNVGQAASGYGAGGGGASTTVSQTAKVGGAGTAGIVIVSEYY